GSTWYFFLASLAAAAKASRLITAEPRPVAPTSAAPAPVRALAPRNPRRLSPVFSFSDTGLLLLSVMVYLLEQDWLFSFADPSVPPGYALARCHFCAVCSVYQPVADTCYRCARSSGNRGSNDIRCGYSGHQGESPEFRTRWRRAGKAGHILCGVSASRTGGLYSVLPGQHPEGRYSGSKLCG